MMKTRLIGILILTCTLMAAGTVCAQTPYWPAMPQYYQQPQYTQQPMYFQPSLMPHLPPQTQYPSLYPPIPQVPVQPQPQTGYWQSANEMYQYGLALVRVGRYNEAIQLFRQFLACYPKSSLADNALYWTGESYYAQKCYSTALWYFQTVLSRYPKGNKVPDAMLKIALSYFSMKQDARGCQMLSQLVQQYPKSEPAQKAYRWFNRCGWTYYHNDNYASCPPVNNGYTSPSYTYGDSLLPKNW